MDQFDAALRPLPLQTLTTELKAGGMTRLPVLCACMRMTV